MNLILKEKRYEKTFKVNFNSLHSNNLNSLHSNNLNSLHSNNLNSLDSKHFIPGIIYSRQPMARGRALKPKPEGRIFNTISKVSDMNTLVDS